MIIPTLQKNKIIEIIYLTLVCVDILTIENTNEGKYIYIIHIPKYILIEINHTSLTLKWVSNTV